MRSENILGLSGGQLEFGAACLNSLPNSLSEEYLSSPKSHAFAVLCIFVVTITWRTFYSESFVILYIHLLFGLFQNIYMKPEPCLVFHMVLGLMVLIPNKASFLCQVMRAW